MKTNNSPAVSVIIPVYNGSNYLREAIDSVLAQTFTDFEILVIDDGSTDNTWEIIQSYGDRVRAIRKPNGGVSSALNMGIRESRGRWVAWLSHDDIFLPTKLEKQVALLKENPQFKACYTGDLMIDADGNVIGKHEPIWYPRDQAVRVLFRYTYMNGSSMLFDRACFESVGLFREELKATQEVEMWSRLVSNFEIGMVNECLLKYRFHPSQGSWNLNVHGPEKHTMFREMFNKFGVAGIFPELSESANDPKVIAWAYEWFGDTMLTHHRLIKFAEEQYRHSLTLWPSYKNRARLKYWMVKLLGIGEPLLMRIRHTIGTWALKSGLRKRIYQWMTPKMTT